MTGRLTLLLLVLAPLACRSDGSTEPPVPAYDIASVAQDGITGPAGARLPLVPVARVTNSSGAAVQGVVVTLRLPAGAPAGFALPESRVTTGADGIARADLQLGSGSTTLRATAPGSPTPEVTIPVVASAPPTLTAVQPTSFGAGEAVTISGTGFPSGVSSTVLVGGLPATILGATGSTLTIRAPACVAAGATTVTLIVGTGVTSNTLPATYVSSSAAPSLDLYQAVTVPASQAATCLSLEGSGARYLVMPQYATSDAATSLEGSRPSFVLGTGPVGPIAVLETASAELPPQQALDVALRRRERNLAPHVAGMSAAQLEEPLPMAQVTVGSTRSFRVLSRITGPSDQFANVTGRARYVGQNIIIYVDEEAPPNGFNDAQLTALGNLFDQRLYRVAVEAFGSESDIDRNERVVVLMTPVVNQLTSRTVCEQTGFVTGFFYGLDLTTFANSNRAEIFYSLVPDPSGATGSCSHSVSQVLQLIPATFIHEFQHMISWNQHVVVRGGSDEELWLNEALSHIAEELGSLIYERDPTAVRSSTGQLFPDSSQGFINGNLRNALSYLSRSQDFSVTVVGNDASLEERGAGWLFLRWLTDQYGEGILRRLVETRQTGVANIEDKTGESFSRLFGDFSIALASPDRYAPIASIPSRYQFAPRPVTGATFTQIWRRLYETNTPGASTPHPVNPAVLSTVAAVQSSMVPGTMRWFLLQPLVAGRYNVSLTPPAGESFPPTLRAQATVLRVNPTQ